MALPPGFESHPTHLQPRDWTLDLSSCPLPPQVRVRGVLHRMRQHTRSTGYNTVDTRRPGCLVARKQDALSAVGVGPLRSWWGRICAGGALTLTPEPPLGTAGCTSWFPHLWIRDQTGCPEGCGEAERRRDTCEVPAVP